MTYFVDTSDRRNTYLKEYLKEKGKDVKSFDEIEKHQTYKSGDAFVFSPAKKIDEDFANKLPSGITLFCGNLPDGVKKVLALKNIKYKNLLENETFAIKNAQLTAEGVLSIIIENSEKSLYDNRILILGAGRVAKSCAGIFGSLGLKFAIASYNKQKFPQNNFFTKKSYLGNAFVRDLGRFDIIVNTIPAKIFNDKMLGKVQKNAVFIETASVPCLDEEKAKHFKYIKAPGLPQKYCASSAGKLMMKNILGGLQ